MEKEIFKDIPNYEEYYQVSNFGRVKSLSRIMYFNHPITMNRIGRLSKERILRAGKNKNGYLHVALSIGGLAKTKKVHQLVALTFLNHTPHNHEIVIDHINNIRTDNRLDNLQLISQRENTTKDRVGVAGAWKHKKYEGYTSRISINGKKKYLGYFKTERDASQAYQNELKKINGDN